MRKSMRAMCTVTMATVLFPLLTAEAVWKGASTGVTFDGAHRYLEAGNWDGDIDDSFAGFSFTAATTLYITNNHAMAGGWNFNYTGAFGLTLAGANATGAAAEWEAVLGGDILCETAPSAAEVLINAPLRVNLGDDDRVFTVGAGRTLHIHGINGTNDIIKTGAGFLRLSGGETTGGDFSGNLIVNEGTLFLAGATATRGQFAMGTNTVSMPTAYLNEGTALRVEGQHWQGLAQVPAPRFVFSNAFITAVANSPEFLGVLCGDTPIVKIGSARFTFSASGSNEFTRGLIVQEGQLQLNSNPARLGLDVPGNDIIVTNGGVLVANNATMLDGNVNRGIIVDTTDPTRLSGIGVGANVACLPFTVWGDNPGIIYLYGVSTRPDSNDSRDADAIAALRAGWYLGGEYVSAYNRMDLPAGLDGNYRLMIVTPPLNPLNGFFIVATNALTGDNGLIIGSPKVQAVASGVANIINLNAPQDYMGKTLIFNNTLALHHDGALTGTSEIRLKNIPSVMVGNTPPCLTISGTPTQSGAIQRTPVGVPIIMESGQNRVGTPAEATIRVSLAPANGMSVTNRLGAITMLSGRSQFLHGFSAALATNQSFYVRTEAPSITRENRSVGVFGQGLGNKDLHTPDLGFWSTGGKTRDGGNVFVVTNHTSMTAHLVGEGGGTYDTPIIPYLFGHDFNNAPGSWAGGNIGAVPVTYDPVTGFRVLRFVADANGNGPELRPLAAGYDPATVGENDNVDTTAAMTHSANMTVGSLRVGGTQTVQGGVTIKVKSGWVGANYGMLWGGGTIDFGDKEGFLMGRVYECRPSLAGTSGLTISYRNYADADHTMIFGGTVTNSYSGQTTLVNGSIVVQDADCSSALNAVTANGTLPDHDLVLLHPDTSIQIGRNNASYGIREVIGSLGGLGEVRLGYTGHALGSATQWRNSGLVIGKPATDAQWETWTNASGRVTLNGGTLSPGMKGKRGTLSFTRAMDSATPYPVDLLSGTLEITIDKDGEGDAIDVLGALTMGAGMTLKVNIETGYAITAGDKWTIATAGFIAQTTPPFGHPSAGGEFFRKVVCSDEKWTFTVENTDGALVMTACRAPRGTTILVR